MDEELALQVANMIINDVAMTTTRYHDNDPSPGHDLNHGDLDPNSKGRDSNTSSPSAPFLFTTN